MSPAESIALASGIVSFVKQVPQAVEAIEELLAAHKAGHDTTPAEKKLVAIAEARALGLDPSKV